MGELGGAGRKGSNYRLVHKLNLGLCTDCSRTSVCVCLCMCVAGGHRVKRTCVSVCV